MSVYTHRGRAHVYQRRRNPSGCDKFYCLRKYRPLWYFGFIVAHPRDWEWTARALSWLRWRRR